MMIYESLLFRFNSFRIIAFSHLYCWPVGLAGCLVRHRERINRENREIERQAKRRKITDTYWPPKSICGGHVGGLTLTPPLEGDEVK